MKADSLRGKSKFQAGAVTAFLMGLQILSLQQTASADEPIQGRIEERSSLKRLSRPALPSRPVGEALEHVANKVKKRANAADSLSSMLDKSSFDTFAKSLQGTADGADKDLLIEWEQWHKNLCSNIYHHWLNYGNIPGDGSVVLHISKAGDIDFELKDFHVDAAEQFSPDQRRMFEQSVAQTLQMVDQFVLNFPLRSQRGEISLTTRFTHSDRIDGPAGYTWKRGDYERVSPR